MSDSVVAMFTLIPLKTLKYKVHIKIVDTRNCYAHQHSYVEI